MQKVACFYTATLAWNSTLPTKTRWLGAASLLRSGSDLLVTRTGDEADTSFITAIGG